MNYRYSSILLFLILFLVVAGSVAAEETYVSVTMWGSYGTANGQFRYPNGICIDNAGNVYVADGGYEPPLISNYRIQKFMPDGTYITQWGSYGSGNGQFVGRIQGIATDGQYVYVCDHDNHRIQKFTLEGVFVSTWGSQGTGPGQFMSPFGVTVAPNGNIFITDSDYGLSRIQKFTPDGFHLGGWSVSGSPRGIACDADGFLYVSTHFGHVIRKYDTTGNYISQWGGYGTGDGQFAYPSGVACDNQGRVYVTDQHNHRIQKFTSEGVFVTKWGSPGSGGGQLASPWYLTVDNQGYVYVCEGDNHRVQKFGLAPSSDLVLYLSFDEGTGSIAYDGSPYSHNGTIHGANWVDGVSGHALIFDGIDDWVQINHTSILNVPAITMACWVNMAQGEVNSYGSPVHKRSNYHLDIQNSVVKGNINNQYGDHWLTDGTIMPDEWYFLTLTYVDGDSLRLFVNGNPVAVRECQGIIGQAGFDLFVGKRQENDRYFEGMIDEVRIYNRALSQSEIQDLYNVAGNQPPVAVIDSIYPYATGIGEDVAFGGHGEDPDNDPIVAFVWKIDDEVISNQNHFVTNTLTEGLHTVAFQVQDAYSQWSNPVFYSVQITDGLVFRPPYDDCRTSESNVGISEVASSCNANSGYVGVFTKALAGHSCAAAGTNIYFNIDEPKTIMVASRLRSCGGKVAQYPAVAGSEFGYHLYRLEDNDWKLKYIYFGYLDNPIDYNWIIGHLLNFLSPYVKDILNIQQPITTMISLIRLCGGIGNWQQLQQGLDLVDYENHSFAHYIKVNPGWYCLSTSLQSRAVGVAIGWSAITRMGQIRYITVKEVENVADNELIITALSPVDLLIIDPQGHYVSKDTSGIASAVYTEADIDFDGHVDDHVCIPNAINDNYTITVLPDTAADSTETYTILVCWDGNIYTLAKDVAIGDIPNNPYVFLTGTPAVTAAIDISPNVLNLKSNGRWITCYIELPNGYDVNDIEAEEVFLNRSIRAESHPCNVGDHDNDGIPDLMVKFNRTAVTNIIEIGDAVEIYVAGHIAAEMFGGADTIRVIMPGGGPQGSEDAPGLPTSFCLSQNQPNPFKSTTRVMYALPRRSHATLRVYNVTGQLVENLVDQTLEPGYYTVFWNGSDRLGRSVAGGVYFLRFDAGDYTATEKVLLVR